MTPLEMITEWHVDNAFARRNGIKHIQDECLVCTLALLKKLELALARQEYAEFKGDSRYGRLKQKGSL